MPYGPLFLHSVHWYISAHFSTITAHSQVYSISTFQHKCITYAVQLQHICSTSIFQQNYSTFRHNYSTFQHNYSIQLESSVTRSLVGFGLPKESPNQKLKNKVYFAPFLYNRCRSFYPQTQRSTTKTSFMMRQILNF